ncbi:hypothetical protein B0H10DRAFT_2013923 [Mycena sp. CBHHK59/15]|nr:hypothetical protein B0H10DRAFT_2013923 [Mycena sp. CBHHK59/15]
MRLSTSSLVACVALVLSFSTSAAAKPSPTTPRARREFLSLNPPRSVLSFDTSGAVIRGSAAAPRSAAAWTNAERFARGLPPSRPASLRRNRRQRRTGTSPLPPVTVTGTILVSDSSGPLGYLTSQLNDFGETGYYTALPANAMSVSVSYSLDAPSQLDVTVLNPGSGISENLFGGIVGFSSDSDDLSVGSSNYNYLGYVSHTPMGAPPVSGANTFSDSTQDDEDIESSIWSYDPVTGALAPQWLNSDSSAPPTSIMYVVEEPLFALTGDPETFVNTFGIGEVVTFTLVL